MMRMMVWASMLGCCLAVAQPQGLDLAHSTGPFSFLINADPQIGPSDSKAGIERELHRLLAQFVEETNAISPPPAFVVFNGDLVAFPKPKYFEAFGEVLERLKPPAVLVHGNHDGRYPQKGFPELQQAIMGIQLSDYAFTCGKWRMIVLGCPEMRSDPDPNASQLQWLDTELSGHPNQPVMVLLHYHLLPVGLSQLEYYTYPMNYKVRLLETLTRYGNVRYVFSGHVHSGVQASVKSAWMYKGTRFVVVPSPVPPRSFGEEYPEFLSGDAENRGYYLEVAIDEEKVQLFGRKTGSNARHAYPEAFPEFMPTTDPRALVRIPQLPTQAELLNGGFDQGFDGWSYPWRYLSDTAPAFDWKVAPETTHGVSQAAHLYCREKGHAWAYDESVEMYQLVALPKDSSPTVKCRYFVPTEDKSPFGGGYVRLSAYAGDDLRCMMLFHWGAREDRVRHLPQIFAYTDTGENRGAKYLRALADRKALLAWRLPDYYHRWHDLTVNLPAAYDQAVGEKGRFKALGTDRLLIAFGVWCGMEPGSFSGAWFDDFQFQSNGDEQAQADDIPLPVSESVFNAPYGQWYLDGFDK